MQQGGTPQIIYAEAFRRIPGLIDGSDPEVSAIEESLQPLRHQVELVEQGQITRTQINSRFAQPAVSQLSPEQVAKILAGINWP